MIGMMRTWGLCVCVIGGAFAGCGGGGGGDAANIEDLPNAYAQATCDVFEECFGSFADDVFGSCVEFLRSQIEDQTLPLWESAIAAGTLEYDGAAANRCLDAVRGASCAAVTLEPAACTDVFVGSVATGSSCATSEECAGDAYCLVESMCPGTCTATVGSGMPCGDDEECSTDLVCIDGTCGSPVGEGASCVDDDECAGFLSCFNDRCTSLPDLATAGSGDSCDPDAGVLCRPGLSCVVVGFDLMTETVMWECVGSSSSGGACNFGAPDPCPSGQACDADIGSGSFEGTCQQLPTAGMPCEVQCATDLECIDGTCRELQRLGSSCTSGEECYSSECSGGVCVTPSCL